MGRGESLGHDVVIAVELIVATSCLLRLGNLENYFRCVDTEVDSWPPQT